MITVNEARLYLQEISKNPKMLTNQLGSGAFGSAYLAPGYQDLVIKKGQKFHTDGYLFWALITKLSNSINKYAWMPKIDAIHIDFSTMEYIVLMEKLKTNWQKAPFYTSSPASSDIPWENHMSKFESTLNNRKLKKNQIAEIISVFNELQPAIMNLKIRIDAHNGNWMYRPGGQIVLTDPFTVEGGSAKKSKTAKIMATALKTITKKKPFPGVFVNV